VTINILPVTVLPAEFVKLLLEVFSVTWLTILNIRGRQALIRLPELTLEPVIARCPGCYIAAAFLADLNKMVIRSVRGEPPTRHRYRVPLLM